MYNTGGGGCSPVYTASEEGHAAALAILFQNGGDGTFQDVTLTAGVTMGRWSWSSHFADVNNDSHEDLLIANGMVTSAEDTGDL